MNRREALLGVLLAPLIKPLASLLPASPALSGGRYAAWTQISHELYEYNHGYNRVMMDAARRVNEQIEDAIINGGPPMHQNCRCLPDTVEVVAVYEDGRELEEVVHGSVNIPTLGIR